MKLSVLIPTRNRLDLLKTAVETVRRQSGGDWELVISDNDSDEDVGGYVASLDDPRIHYHHTGRFIPVTDNWNNALEHSSGDYVVMLGDDDGLLPGYIEDIEALVERYDTPDLIYHSALQLTQPGVHEGEQEGFLTPHGYAFFLQGAHEPFVLDRATSRRCVDDAMNFSFSYGYNSQFVVVSRRLLDELTPHGPFYQSRFPDYYSTNVAFLKARSIVVQPRALVVIGVSPKSYGFYHVNNREGEGKAFLNADAAPEAALEDIMLPGSNINVGWLSAVEAIAREFGEEFGIRVNRGRFRTLQVAHVYEQYVRGTIGSDELAELEAHLNPVERVAYRAAAVAAKGGATLLPARLRLTADYVFHSGLGQYPEWNPARLPGSYETVLDVFESQLVAGAG